MKYYQHKDTDQITVCVTIQGPAWTLADIETGICMNIEKRVFREEWKEVPPPYPCQKPKEHFNGNHIEIMQGHCLICKAVMEESV